MGTTLRISELSPVVANLTLPRAGFDQAGSVARPRRVRAAEALERVGKEVGREAVALVADVDLDPPVGRPRPDADRARAMAQRVLDQVPDRLLDAHAVCLDGFGRRFL